MAQRSKSCLDHTPNYGASKEKDVTGDEQISDDLLHMMQQQEGDADCVNDDGFENPLTSDDDDEMRDFPTYDPKIDSENPQLKLGLIFNSKKEAKFVIESHCFRRGMLVKFVKNDGKRLRAKCTNNGCGWLIHVSMMTNDSCWQVKTFEEKHDNCVWKVENKCITSTWLGKTFVQKFITNPKLGSLEFKNEIHTSMNAKISKKVAYLAKRKALSLVEGSVEEQFGKIRNYCAELKRIDRDTTVILKCTEDEGRPRFQRMYVCFSACKFGFQNACRPVIGIDGCFLKSKTGGRLLSAVGLDPNNNIFPICYALVEGETKDTWMWFLQLLAGDVNIENDYAWTFMSDKQKGLIPALESLFSNAEHRFCVRHMHSNMKNDGYKSVAVKNALWAAAKATTVNEFRKRMQELKEIDRNAYEWLAKKPESHWSKAFFSIIPNCDILLNIMCECFNSLILDARDKTIIEMFEAIRNLMMRRFQLNREKAEKWHTRNCPRIRAILAKISLEAAKLIPMKSDDMHFQIKATNSQEQYTVFHASMPYVHFGANTKMLRLLLATITRLKLTRNVIRDQ
ncbi:uncharacterized protein [Henckelia pumila]|uniref:uncharacterized protein n=1 Tax=Henckelia pumila TaxID=405737 RepID=UPI003C6E5B35